MTLFTVHTMVATGSTEPRTQLARVLGEFAAILFLCVAILAPGIILRPDWPEVRSELLFALVIIGVYIWLLLAGLVRGVTLHRFYFIGLLFSICISISLIFGSLVLGHQVLFKDLYEIPKACMPVLFFSVAYEAELSEAGLKRFMNCFAIAITLVCLFGWAQFLGFRIATWLQPYYGDSAHNDIALVLYKRIYSTMTNPNYLGQLLSWTLAAYTLAFLFGVGSRFRNLFVASICFLTATLTSSRYALLASGFGLLLVLMLAMQGRRRVGKFVGLLLLLGIFGLIYGGAVRSSYFAARRFEELKKPTDVASLRGRLDVLWLDAAQEISNSPWVGHGPAKKYFDEVYTDSEYLDILKWYGIIGFLVYAAYYVWPLLQLTKAMRSARTLDPMLKNHLSSNLLNVRIGFVILCMALFMNFGEFTCFHWILMGFLWGWADLAVRSAHFVCRVADKRSLLKAEKETEMFCLRGLGIASAPVPE